MGSNFKQFHTLKGKWYASFPGATALFVVWGFAVLYFAVTMLICLKEQQLDGFWLCFFNMILSIVIAYITIRNAVSYIKLYVDPLVCLVPFTRRITIRYDNCEAGLDYCLDVNRNKLWWIYISEGPLPQYPGKNPRNRINTIPCQKGFVRIRYQKEIFLALIEVLPKKQRTALISAERFMD